MKTFYVTTAIDYANAPPHLGHAYEKVAADVLARWHRQRGDKTFFLTGTDEHGAKIARAAEKEALAPEEFVLRHRGEFVRLLLKINASNDDFIYTSDQKRHWPGVKKMWRALETNDDLYKSIYRGLYCIGHEAFVTEKDLVGGICADHNQKPEVIEEENYFFRLSKYLSKVRTVIETGEFAIFPESRRNEVLAFLKERVEDISFSRPRRDISWGIPVPGDAEHTVYVWADALPNYITALGYGTDNDEKFKSFWPADLHIIGKDILRFHAVIWPAMLMALGLPLPRALFVHGMILSGGQKMSKTLGNVVDPDEVIDAYGADAFRYFLMREIPFGEDGDFTRERFLEVYEGNLAHGIGNLVSRISAMVKKYFDRVVAKPKSGELASVPTRRGESLERYFDLELLPRYEKAMEGLRLTEALTLLSGFFSLLDGYIQDYEPFRLVKTDPEKTKLVLWNAAWHLCRAADLLEPFTPATAGEIKKIFNIEHNRMIVLDHAALFPSKKS